MIVHNTKVAIICNVNTSVPIISHGFVLCHGKLSFLLIGFAEN